MVLDAVSPCRGKDIHWCSFTTLVVLFSLNGDVLLHNFDALLLISVPLILGFVIVVGYNLDYHPSL